MKSIEYYILLNTFFGLFVNSWGGFSFKNPVIQEGFVAVNTSSASWDSLSSHWGRGLVIQDASGNQFVRVPVDGADVPYAKMDYKGATMGCYTGMVKMV